ncbi:MAG: hypothetical protein ACTSRZ_09070 [Promethearchaeota archaeon]
MGFKKINEEFIKKMAMKEDFESEFGQMNLDSILPIEEKDIIMDRMGNENLYEKNLPNSRVLCFLEQFENFYIENKNNSLKSNNKFEITKYQSYDKLIVTNPSEKHKLWDIYLQLLRNNAKIELNINELMPKESWNWTSNPQSDANLLNQIRPPIDVHEEILVENLQNKNISSDVVLITPGIENIIRYRIAVKNNTSNKITNLKLLKLLPANTIEIIDINSDYGDFELNKNTISWNINNLNKNTIVFLEFSLKLNPYSKENSLNVEDNLKKINELNTSGDIKVQYSFQADDLDIRLIDFRCRSKYAYFNSIDRDPLYKDSWNYSALLINQCDFELELINGCIKYIDNTGMEKTLSLNKIESIPPYKQEEIIKYNVHTKNKPNFKANLNINTKNEIFSTKRGIIEIKGQPIKYTDIIIEKSLSHYYFPAFQKFDNLKSKILIENNGNLAYNSYVIIEKIPQDLQMFNPSKNLVFKIDNFTINWQQIQEQLPSSIEENNKLITIDLAGKSFDSIEINNIFKDIESYISFNKFFNIKTEKPFIKKYILNSNHNTDSLLVIFISQIDKLKSILKQGNEKSNIDSNNGPNKDLDTNNTLKLEISYLLKSDGLSTNKIYKFPFKVFYSNPLLKGRYYIFNSKTDNTPEIVAKLITESVTIGKVVDYIEPGQYYIRLLLRNNADNPIENLFINELIPSNAEISNTRYKYEIVDNKNKEYCKIRWSIKELASHKEIEIRYLLSIKPNTLATTDLNNLEFWIEHPAK